MVPSLIRLVVASLPIKRSGPDTSCHRSTVERTIGIIYHRVYAPLAGTTIDSLPVLNTVITSLVNRHNQAVLQGKDYSRQDRFRAIEKAALLPLPVRPFVYKQYQQARVGRNNHVLLSEDKHYYSVPFRYVGQIVKLVSDGDTVEIYHQYERIAVHARHRLRHGYSTQKEHLPVAHQYLMNGPEIRLSSEVRQ